MTPRKLILKYSPINYWRKKKCVNYLNHNITILASNCIGGMIYSDYGQQFISPTINVRLASPEFVKFVCDLEYYLNCKLAFVETNESYPVAILGDITIYFVHYKTKEEAEKKWNERKQRIDYDNIFIITNDRDGMTEDDFRKLDSCKYKNILVFTAKQYNYNCTFQVRQFKHLDVVDNTIKRNLLTGAMLCQEIFDFTGWFNQENGTNINNYRLK